jgi:hypothetical protein
LAVTATHLYNKPGTYHVREQIVIIPGTDGFAPTTVGLNLFATVKVTAG